MPEFHKNAFEQGVSASAYPPRRRKKTLTQRVLPWVGLGAAGLGGAYLWNKHNQGQNPNLSEPAPTPAAEPTPTTTATPAAEPTPTTTATPAAESPQTVVDLDSAANTIDQITETMEDTGTSVSVRDQALRKMPFLARTLFGEQTYGPDGSVVLDANPVQRGIRGWHNLFHGESSTPDNLYGEVDNSGQGLHLSAPEVDPDSSEAASLLAQDQNSFFYSRPEERSKIMTTPLVGNAALDVYGMGSALLGKELPGTVGKIALPANRAVSSLVGADMAASDATKGYIRDDNFLLNALNTYKDRVMKPSLNVAANLGRRISGKDPLTPEQLDVFRDQYKNKLFEDSGLKRLYESEGKAGATPETFIKDVAATPYIGASAAAGARFPILSDIFQMGKQSLLNSQEGELKKLIQSDNIRALDTKLLPMALEAGRTYEETGDASGLAAIMQFLETLNPEQRKEMSGLNSIVDRINNTSI